MSAKHGMEPFGFSGLLRHEVNTAVRQVQNPEGKNEEQDRYPLKHQIDYTAHEWKYRPDLSSEEGGAFARAWYVYVERSRAIDDQWIEAANDQLEILLTVAGLFGTVSSALVGQINDSKNPWYDQFLSYMAWSMWELHRTGSNHILTRSPDDDLWTPSSHLRWMYRCAQISQFLNASVTFLALLAKQWINEYSARTRAPAPNPRFWAYRRYDLNAELTYWKMTYLIESLPVLMQGSIILYLIALVGSSWLDDDVLGKVLAVLVAGFVAVVVISLLIPLRFGSSPFMTPVQRILYRIYQGVTFSVTKRRPRPAFDERVLMAEFERRQFPDLGPITWMSQTLPGKDDIFAANDYLGAVDADHVGQDTKKWSLPTDERTRSVQQSLWLQFADLDAARGSVEPDAVRRCLKSMIATKFNPAPQHQIQFNAALRRWQNIGQFDVNLLSGRLINMFRIPDIVDVAALSAHESAEHPCHAQTLHHLLHIGLREKPHTAESSEQVATILACEIIYMRTSGTLDNTGERAARVMLDSLEQRHALEPSDLLSMSNSVRDHAPQPVHLVSGDFRLRSYLALSIELSLARNVAPALLHVIYRAQTALVESLLISGLDAVFESWKMTPSIWSQGRGNMVEEIMMQLSTSVGEQLSEAQSAAIAAKCIASVLPPIACGSIVLAQDEVSAELLKARTNLLIPSTISEYTEREQTSHRSSWELACALLEPAKLVDAAVHLSALLVKLQDSDARSSAWSTLVGHDFAIAVKVIIGDTGGDRAVRIAQHSIRISRDQWKELRRVLRQCGSLSCGFDVENFLSRVKERSGACSQCSPPTPSSMQVTPAQYQDNMRPNEYFDSSAQSKLQLAEPTGELPQPGLRPLTRPSRWIRLRKAFRF